jgi:hypothetical protein
MADVTGYHWVVIGQGLSPAAGDKPEPFQMNGQFFKLGAVLTDDEASHLQAMPSKTKIRRIPVGAHPNRLPDGSHVRPGEVIAPKTKPEPEQPPQDKPAEPKPIPPPAAPIAAPVAQAPTAPPPLPAAPPPK